MPDNTANAHLPPRHTAPTRRQWLQQGLRGAALVAAPALVQPAAAQALAMPTPHQTEGPYYPVDFPADSDADLLRNGMLRYTQGEAVWVEGRVTDTQGVPLAGGTVEIWQCDAKGHYHHPGDGGKAAQAFQGFGRVVLGRDGQYRFRTIRPAPYTGRTPHIHFKVRLPGRELLTTQMYVAGDAGNARDYLWSRLSEKDRAALTVRFAPAADGMRGEFPIVVQT
ncbi:protocatechuate 3,4-dioxygenase [Acidovorax sp. sic0104]|uniref:dioxygenase family protein n=1 Tax=Acidovorax sp. sic0104 TaxID=2854784 RepID=UPI001C46FE8B|nr:protocatechuate 3,4-dioxygenase [Acidovorax sp. sic0104]MBV7540952.1 intradiol ring-cleavage dioxygenase [Acidovorax sp. sic0104]